MLKDLSVLLLRDLDSLRREVEMYPDDAAVWQPVPGAPNAGGTLVLHLVGNLRHFIGATLGGTGYVRDRESEFASRGVSRRELLDLIATTRSEIADTLRRLSPEATAAPYPIAVGGFTPPTGRFLLHLSTHLAFHLGQLDSHRRAATGDSASAGVVSIAALTAAEEQTP